MNRKRMGMIATTALGVVAAAAAGLACLRRRFDVHLFSTMSGTAAVYRASEGVRVLRVGGVFQSATYLDERRFDPVFEYYRGFDAMFAVDDALSRALGHGVNDVLLLGGGGFAYPKHLLTSRDNVSLDVVEIDPAIVSAARRWFFLDELEQRLEVRDGSSAARLRVFVADGRAFLDEPRSAFELSLPAEDASRWARTPQLTSCGAYAGPKAADPAPSSAPVAEVPAMAQGRDCYDAILDDCFSGGEPVRALATLEAARAVRARLVPGGVYLSNVVSRNDGTDLSFLRCTVGTLAGVFAHVYVVPSVDEEFGGEDNYLVVATDTELDLPDAIPFDGDFLGTPLTDDNLSGAD